MSFTPRATRLGAALLCSSAACLPFSSHGWVSENKALVLKPGLVTGDAPASEPVQITISLKLANQSQLDQFVTALKTPGSPAYGRFMTSQQFMDQFAPTAAQAKTVADYLSASGFTDVNVFPGRSLITARGTAAVAQKAFNTHLVDFVSGAKQQYANVTDVQVPDALAGLVQNVAGLNNIQYMHLHTHRLPATNDPVVRQTPATGKAGTAAGAAVTHSGYTGPEFQTAYDAAGVPTGSRTTIAIITSGDDLSTVINDLRIAELVNNQPVIPVQVVQVVPITTPDTSGDDEWDLDSQASTGIAENVKQLIFYNSDALSDASIIASVQRFADDNIAQIGNQSFGGCEIEGQGPSTPETGTNFAGYEAAYQKAVAQGQTFFTSTGDTGSTCGSPVNTGYPTGVPGAEYPSSSPNNVAAGGTTLSTDADYNYVSETSWIGGGGGISEVFAPPQWQIDSGAVPSASIPSGPVNPVTPGSTGTGRGTPDVAMSADPASGLSTVVAGARETVGGTSLSAPLSTGSYARMESARCNSLGFAAPLFYALDTGKGLMSTAAGFNDITSGTNGVYAATTGWDYNTGFGTFDIAKVNAALPTAPCSADQNPIAKLAANTSSGAYPLNVTFDETGSSDPDNDGVPYYIINFGDGSVPVIQTTPTFPAHSYSAPGTYTATATVRDGVGNISNPVTLPITVTGTPLSCVVPGQVLITSPAGVNPGVEGMDIGMGTDDLLSVSFAEPADLTDQLVVTMKVNNLTTLTPSFRWITYFLLPNDSNDYYIAMVTDATGTPSYEYGIRTSIDTPAASVGTYQIMGALDASSTETADGTITLVLNKSSLKITTGTVLSAISASVRTSSPNDPTGTQPVGSGLTQDSGSAVLNYMIIGNDVCKADIANPPTGSTGTTTGATTGGATGSNPLSGSNGSSSNDARLSGGAFGYGLLPLLLLGLRRRSLSRRK